MILLTLEVGFILQSHTTLSKNGGINSSFDAQDSNHSSLTSNYLSSYLQKIGYIITYDIVDHKSDRQDSSVQQIVDHGAIHVTTVAPSLPSCGPCLHSTESTMAYQCYEMAR